MVVGALSAPEANIRWEEVLVCRSQVSVVPLDEIARHTPVQHGVRHLGPQHAHLWCERSTLHIVQLTL